MGVDNKTVIANFEPLPGSVTITTIPAGRRITVDGLDYPAPQTFTWLVNTSHIISVPDPQMDDAGLSYVFSNWADGGNRQRSVTVGPTPVTFTANLTPGATYTISGTVRLGGNPLPNANVVLSGSRGDSATTDANGRFTFSALPGGGTYTVTPFVSGTVFCPGAKTFTALAATQDTVFVSGGPTREYIRMGGRVIAIESCGAQ
jgi:hypothetical protein